MTNRKTSEIVLRIVGILLALGGIALAVIGFYDLFSGNIGKPGNLFCCSLLGIFVLAIGLMMTMISFKTAVMERGQRKRGGIAQIVISENADNDQPK